MKLVFRWIWLFALLASLGKLAQAHVGNKDVYQQVTVGPYRLFITIRIPTVLPGVATIEIHSEGATVQQISMTPLPLTGEAALHPPAADVMTRSADDPAFFTGIVWLMGSDSWQVRFGIDGVAGQQAASVPVPAASLAVLPMPRSMVWLLTGLGLVLVLGIVSIVGAAVREARLSPGVEADAVRRRSAWVASGVAVVVTLVIVYLGGVWWSADASETTANLYHPSSLQAVLQGNDLQLELDTLTAKKETVAIKNAALLSDHGHLMHLYAIRMPEMDAVFHLHPSPSGKSHFEDALPSMPAGTYKLYADVVRANGFPETATTELTIPAGMNGGTLGAEDASAMPAPLSAGNLGTTYHLPDHYRMIWDKPTQVKANTPYALRFRLVDTNGDPATDMTPCLGMAGHAAFVKADGTAFAHTHPEGSAAMQAMMLANENTMADMVMPSPEIEFPYGFPSTGRYRIFVQMKHGDVLETGVFDADVR